MKSSTSVFSRFICGSSRVMVISFFAFGGIPIMSSRSSSQFRVFIPKKSVTPSVWRAVVSESSSPLPTTTARDVSTFTLGSATAPFSIAAAIVSGPMWSFFGSKNGVCPVLGGSVSPQKPSPDSISDVSLTLAVCSLVRSSRRDCVAPGSFLEMPASSLVSFVWLSTKVNTASPTIPLLIAITPFSSGPRKVPVRMTRSF